MAIFSNLGKVYVTRALDIPPSTGFGEPINSLFGLVDGEFAVGFIAPDSIVSPPREKPEMLDLPSESIDSDGDASPQYFLFGSLEQDRADSPDEGFSVPVLERGILITRNGKGFRFDYSILRESTKRSGRKLVSLAQTDEVVAAIPEDGQVVAIAVDSGRMLAFPVDQVPVLAGPGQGVRMIKVTPESHVVGLALMNIGDSLQIDSKEGKEQILEAADIPMANRSTRGKKVAESISALRRLSRDEGYMA